MEEVRTPIRHVKKRNIKRDIVIILVILVVLAVVGFFWSSTPSFCGRCHELKPFYDTWKVSTHRNVSCIDCHSEPGFLNYLKHKLGSWSYIFAHITGQYPHPIKLKRDIPNESCERCHTRNRVVSPGGDLIIPHEHHLNQLKLKCFNCHSNLHVSISEAGLVTSPLAGAAFYHKLCWEKCHNGVYATNKCSSCHTKKALPVSHKQPDFLREHGRAYSKKEDCAKCHGYTPDFCRDCHTKKPSSHLAGNFKATHRYEIKNKGLSTCMACHAEDNICLRCHD